MLTADLVNARRRGSDLHLVSLDKEARVRALELASRLIDVVAAHVNETQEDLAAALATVDSLPRDVRMRDGFAKLLEDRCDFGASTDIDPEEIRREVFTLASTMRAEKEPGEKLDRVRVLQAVAQARGASLEAIEHALFADLRGAQVMKGCDAVDAVSLVLAYEQGQAQAVLLRAVKITVDVEKAGAGATRALFRRLKFLRLLHVITNAEDGYRIVIDGPFSLFESATKYGLQLALVLPALEGCADWKLVAEVRWGKERLPLTFRLEGHAEGPAAKDPPLPSEVATVLKSFNSLGSKWRASANTKILDLPGVGLTIPDLVFQASSAAGKPLKVYLEVMGYWSRAAVWQRVELVQAGLRDLVLFAVSSRLRVSEEVLDEASSGALYVYKGTMSARAIEARLDALATAQTKRAPGPDAAPDARSE